MQRSLLLALNISVQSKDSLKLLVQSDFVNYKYNISMFFVNADNYPFDAVSSVAFFRHNSLKQSIDILKITKLQAELML